AGLERHRRRRSDLGRGHLDQEGRSGAPLHVAGHAVVARPCAWREKLHLYRPSPKGIGCDRSTTGGFMNERLITLPEIALIAGTRGLLGFGIGLLVAGRLSERQRNRLAVPLIA